LTTCALFQRVGLLRARLVADAAPDDVAAIYGAMQGGGRFAAFHDAPHVMARTLAKPVAELDQADALSLACYQAFNSPYSVRGWTEPFNATGLGVMGVLGVVMTRDWFFSQDPERRAADDVAIKLLTLTIELLRSGDLPELAIGGAWWIAGPCALANRPAAAALALELGMVELAVAHLRDLGSPADWITISRGKGGRANAAINAVGRMQDTSPFAGQDVRPDVEACVSSGLVDECCAAVTAFEARGVEGLGDVNHFTVSIVLEQLKLSMSHPVCEQKVRGMGRALGFCLENSLDMCEEIGISTGATATQICCGVFGRDEGGSDFAFKQVHVDSLLTRWSNCVMDTGPFKGLSAIQPNADRVQVLELCISDTNKLLLLANPAFVPYLVNGLILGDEHPRADLKHELKVWCQEHHAECCAQLAQFPTGKEALQQDSSVMEALQAVVDKGLSEHSREFGRAALLSLKSEEGISDGSDDEIEPEHIMLSYQVSAPLVCACERAHGCALS
jgi:hypothetical protein